MFSPAEQIELSASQMPAKTLSAIEQEAEVATALLGGGDERIALDPATGCNRYGARPRPSADEAQFGSSTASTITALGFAAAAAAWRRLIERESDRSAYLRDWFDGIRDRLTGHFALPGSACVLAPSGTELELVVVAIALSSLKRPLTNIVVAPHETGRGVSLAAAGSHFLETAPFKAAVRAGERIMGWEDKDIRVECVEIREPDGRMRSADAIDAAVEICARNALAAGRSVLVHILDASKTGQAGLRLGAASEILARAPERVIVLADCCQLRSTPARLRNLLARGFLVAITGSKFVGGPAFAGALFVPPSALGLLDRFVLPPGLAAHTSLLDWPERLQQPLRSNTRSDVNVGLGLRWTAALKEIDRFHELPSSVLVLIQRRFRDMVVHSAATVAGLRPVVEQRGEGAKWADSIVPIAMTHREGVPFSLSDARKLQEALRHPLADNDGAMGRGFQLGQPVQIGGDVALRVCLSMPIMSDIAERISGELCFDDAFEPLAQDVSALFQKWSVLAEKR